MNLLKIKNRKGDKYFLVCFYLPLNSIVTLYPLLQYPLNNVGDPLIESTYDLNSRSIEREVVQFFAELFRAPKENSWGYVTNGGAYRKIFTCWACPPL